MSNITELRPTVLVIGGFISSPPMYRRLRERLLRRGAAAVVVANLWTPDWLLITVRGHGPTATRAGRALLAAGRVSAAEPASAGAPVLVVGHSAGGVLARILTSPVPFEGRTFGAARRIGAIVTLGTPHRVAMGWAHAGEAAQFAETNVPGAYFAPEVGYLTVASTARPGLRGGTPAEQRRWRRYASMLPQDLEPGGPPDRIEADGVTPVVSALVPGTRQLIFDDLLHGQGLGGPWYGSDEGLDQWWDAAVDTWRAALEARAAARDSLDGRGAR